MLDGTIVADACSWEKDAKAKLQSTSDKVGVVERIHSTPRGLPVTQWASHRVGATLSPYELVGFSLQLHKPGRAYVGRDLGR